MRGAAMRLSFRVKTILGIALIEAIALSALTWTGVRSMRAASEQEFLQRAETAVTLFAITVKDGVVAFDLPELQSQVLEILRSPGVVYARVRDHDQRVLAQDGQTPVLAQRQIVIRSLDKVDDGI